MRYSRDVGALARKDLLLELRAKETLPSMLLFVLAALTIFHFALPHGTGHQAALGLLWSLVNPLALMAVYLVVFGILFQRNSNIAHYPLYLLTGLACWIFFATSLQAGARSLVDNADLVKKVRFPKVYPELSGERELPLAKVA